MDELFELTGRSLALVSARSQTLLLPEISTFFSTSFSAISTPQKGGEKIGILIKKKHDFPRRRPEFISSLSLCLFGPSKPPKSMFYLSKNMVFQGERFAPPDSFRHWFSMIFGAFFQFPKLTKTKLRKRSVLRFTSENYQIRNIPFSPLRPPQGSPEHENWSFTEAKTLFLHRDKSMCKMTFVDFPMFSGSSFFGLGTPRAPKRDEKS